MRWSGSGEYIRTIVLHPYVQISVPPLGLTCPSQRTVILPRASDNEIVNQ